MQKTLRPILVVMSIVVLVIVAYALGAMSQYKRNQSIEHEMTAVQAMLSFNHLLRFRELEADLTKGCTNEALAKVHFSVAQEMLLLSSFYQRHNDPEFNKYVTDRDPALLAQLKAYAGPDTQAWKEPKCMK